MPILDYESDELPQLWNVLRGEMSLVGPRPIVEPELSKYGSDASRLLTVKPGLGGMWQVSGRSNTSYPERVAMDMRYIDSRSLWLDLKLLVLTALTIIRWRGRIDRPERGTSGLVASYYPKHFSASCREVQKKESN